MMQYNNRIKRSSLVDNPNARIPVCFCIDSSTSMFFKFKNLKKGIENFYKEVKQDNSIRYSVDLLLTSFSNEPKVVEEFDCVDQHKDKYIQMKAFGKTYLGEALNFALDLLEARKDEFKGAGIDYYQPWLIIISDGKPNGSKIEMERAISRINESTGKNKLAVLVLYCGIVNNKELLTKLSPKNPVYKISAINFSNFFNWLSMSLSSISKSMPGDEKEFDLGQAKPWGEPL